MPPQEQNLGRGASSVQGDSWTQWLREVQAIEFALVMRHVPLVRHSTVLELGCGEGFQLQLLRKRFERVFAIDPGNGPESKRGFARCVAEALPFRDNSFDFVISSSVLEHLTNRERAMAEVRRVLRPGGYAAHVVPTRTWKFTSLALNPVGYPFRVMEKWQTRRHLGRNSDPCSRVEPNQLALPPPREYSDSFGVGSGHPSMGRFHPHGRVSLLRPAAVDTDVHYARLQVYCRGSTSVLYAVRFLPFSLHSSTSSGGGIRFRQHTSFHPTEGVDRPKAITTR